MAYTLVERVLKQVANGKDSGTVSYLCGIRKDLGRLDRCQADLDSHQNLEARSEVNPSNRPRFLRREAFNS